MHLVEQNIFSGASLISTLKMDEVQSYGIGNQAHTYESKERFHSNSLHFLSVLQLNQNITILPTTIGIDTGSALSNRLTTPAPAAIVIR